jgi:hypothetical protein
VSRLRTTIPEPDLNTLRDALIALGTTVRQLTQAPVAGDLPDYGLNVAAALTAVQGDAFVTKLAGVRRRLNAFSKIDIRGCQVGRERTFLTAVQHFFGTSPTVRPTVSGPRWFQHWNEIGFVSARNDGNIGTLFGAGASGYSGAQIQSFLDPWAAGFGIDASHTTFWQTTLGLNALVFAALQWQSGLPATRVPVPRLQALSSANFRDVVARVTQIFLPPNASRPTAAQLTAVDPVLPNAAVWATALTATVGDSENAAQLTARFNDLKAAYEGSDDRASPPAAGRPIPATAPAALTAQNIRDFQTAILSFIDTDAHSRLRPIKQFLTATLAKTQDGPARMRYYLCLGLPFLAFDPAATNANRNFIVVFEDTAGTDRRQEDAVQFWIRAQWQGLIPTSIGTGAHFADSKHTPWLVENHQPGPALSLAPFVVSPTHDYHDKIVIVTP